MVNHELYPSGGDKWTWPADGVAIMEGLAKTLVVLFSIAANIIFSFKACV